ncbi:hypothetical protein HYW54_01310 [Candidatus Gottesmanbacteria bacterium]|nr:hypothetical protein [Candidatus Gottesmanbacteria bacterium]
MDNSAQQNSQQSQTPAAISPSGSMAKEQLGGGVSSQEVLQSVSPELQPSKEVKGVGVYAHEEAVKVPPDLQRMGVSPSGPSTPVTTTGQAAIVLPISDQQVVSGLHAQVYSALRWLAEWCIRKLKKAHLTLKVIHGKIMRVQYTPSTSPE